MVVEEVMHGGNFASDGEDYLKGDMGSMKITVRSCLHKLDAYLLNFEQPLI